jgi:hypothetical protein
MATFCLRPTVFVQMEYVRCFEELRALQALKDNSRSFAVALPGAESRSLQSRAQDDKLLEKLRRRVAKLQVDLGYEEALSVDHPEYRQGLAALRDQQVHKLLKDIERDVAMLGSITQERKQSGASSSLTRSQQRRAKTRRKRIRQLVDIVSAWQQYELPAGNMMGQLPAQWTEQVINNLFKGTFPWKQPADGDAVSVPALLAEQFRDACAEVRRGGIFRACGTQIQLEQLITFSLERLIAVTVAMHAAHATGYIGIATAVGLYDLGPIAQAMKLGPHCQRIVSPP